MLRQDLKHKFMGLNGEYVCAFQIEAPQGKFPIETFHNIKDEKDVYLYLVAAILDYSAEMEESPFSILAQMAGDIKHMENLGGLEYHPAFKGHPALEEHTEVKQ